MIVKNFASSLPGGTQYLSIFEPANLSTGKHPVLLEMQGAGQYGNMSFDSNSVSGQLAAGKKLPPVYADAIVINVHQPNYGSGISQPARFKETYNWVLANYPTADINRISICGLSLGAGGVIAASQNVEFMKLIACIIPCAPTEDFNKGILWSNIIASEIPFRIYGSVADDNAPTRSVFQMLNVLPNYTQALKQGSLVETNSGHTGTWTMAYSLTDSRAMWSWLAAQSRTVVVVPPVVVTPTRKLISSTPIAAIAPVVVPAVTVPATTVPGVPERTVNVYLNPDGSYTSEVV